MVVNTPIETKLVYGSTLIW